MAPTISDVAQVTHTCLIRESCEHARETAAAWLASGLAAGDQVMYFEEEPVGPVLERLADDDVPVELAMSRGQLVVVPHEETVAASATPIDEVEAMFRGAIDDAASGGWPGLRINGESARRTLARGGLSEVVQFETIVTRVLREHPTTRMLCFYDRDEFDAAAVAAMRAVHLSELVTTAIYDDAMLRVTAAGPGRIRFAGEIDHGNNFILDRSINRALEAALRSADGPDRVVVDLSCLRFLDVGGASDLVHLGEQFPTPIRLVLVGVRPRVARVLERCGAAYAPQLSVEPRRTNP